MHKISEGDDSASIQNQRLMLTEYALAHEFQISGVYADDDESGLYDDRPGFEELITDAKSGKFDVVIAKSQSRFSRNMEHVEKYLHHDFPLLGIRFIGVADHADTENMGNKKARQINGLVNEWYCEDLSDNIRSVFQAKMKDGQFLGSSCPYGYRKDPKDHNHLQIDDYAASVVRRIYAWYLDGYGKGKIAVMLSEEGILIPTRYKQEVLGINYKNSNLRSETRAWSYQTIHTILRNPVYKGDLVQNKYHKASYKDKRKVKVPREAWITVKHTHEPIIDPHTFDLAQELQKQRTKSVRAEPNGIFSGKLFCADCKKSMERQYARRGNGGFTGYICKTYKKQGKKFCQSHRILKEELEQTVLESLREEAKQILTPSDIENLRRFQPSLKERQTVQKQRKMLQEQMEKIHRYKKGVLEKYLDHVIMEADYKRYMMEYDRQAAELERCAESFSKAMDTDCGESTEAVWLEAFKNYIGIDRLDRRVVAELIEKIEVGAEKELTIYYKFKHP